MTSSHDRAVLTRVTWLAPLGAAALAAIAVGTRRLILARGGSLWRRGERTDAVAVIVQGRIDVLRDTARGKRMILRSLGPGASAGFSTLGGAAHTADLVAAENSTVVMIPGRLLRDAIRRDPALALRVLAELGETIGRLTDEMEELRFHGLDERLARLLRRRAQGLREFAATHDELAQQAGATRENVSRALKRMERRGKIVCHRGRIEIREL
jgi:CRP/FNR family transcriptional regulator